VSKVAAIIGRFLIALIFIFSGFGKLIDPAGTGMALAGVGLSPQLAIPVGLFELAGGLCLAAGFMVRLVALLLAGFTAATILFFHNRFTDPQQGVMALKNLAIIGGLALAFAHSQMWSHYYAIAREREGEILANKAEARAREAELRAERAEAEARALRSAPGAAPVVAPAPTMAGSRAVDTDGDGYTDTVVRRRRWFDW